MTLNLGATSMLDPDCDEAWSAGVENDDCILLSNMHGSDGCGSSIHTLTFDSLVYDAGFRFAPPLYPFVAAMQRLR